MRYAKLALLAICIVCATTAAAQGTCSVAMLQGTYVVNHTGLIYMGANAPYSLLGVMKADIYGKVESRWVQVNPFGTLRYTQSSHWTVTPDCQLTITHVGGGTSQGFVIGNGEEIRMIITDPLMRNIPGVPTALPGVGSGTLRRISPGANEVMNCSTNMLRGTYAQTCEGFMVATTNPMTFMPMRAAILLKSDGTGKFEGKGPMALNGQVVPVEYKNGVNNVGADCWATASFQLTVQPGTWNEDMIVFDAGKEMISTTTGPTGQIDMCRFTRIGR